MIGFLLALTLALPFSLAGAESLAEQKKHATSLPEFPIYESTELGYQKLYASISPSWWSRLLSSIGLAQGPIWQPTDIVPLIHQLYQDLKALPHTHEITRVVEPGTELIVFGGIHGAFHALVRTLDDLQRRGIMTDDLILKPNVLMVFLGDTVNAAPYSIETLHLILTLQAVNKDHVVFLAGHAETKQAWHNSQFYRELTLRLSSHAKDLAPKIDTIFELLPKEFTVKLKGTEESVFISAFAPEKDRSLKVVITGDEEAPPYEEGQGLYKHISSKGAITWQVVSSPTAQYRTHHRFFYDAYARINLASSLATSTISLYAGSTDYPIVHNVTYELTTGSLLLRGRSVPTKMITKTLSLEELMLRLATLKTQVKALNQEVSFLKKQLPESPTIPHKLDSSPLFEKLAHGAELTTEEVQKAVDELELLYNMLSADLTQLRKLAQRKNFETLAAPEKHTITLGSSLDLSKSAKGLGIPFKTGMSLKMHAQNREGGIHGKRAQIIFLDDAYLPSRAEKNIETLLNVDHTPFILAPVGSPTLAAYLNLVEQKKILVLFPQSGSLLFRKPELTHIINFRASFYDEGRLLTEFVLTKYRPKTFAFFFQDDEFGTSILEGAREGLKGKNSTATEVRYQANTTNFQSAADKIKEANPDAIGFFGTGPAVLQLIRDLGIEFLAQKVLFAVSSVGDTATLKVLKERGISLILGQVVPDPITSTLPIVKEYRKEANKLGIKEDVFSLESYITTSLTFDAMNKVTEPITMQKLIDHFEKLDNYSYKGLTLSFNPAHRSLAQYLWIINKDGTTHEMTIGGPLEKRTS